MTPVVVCMCVHACVCPFPVKPQHVTALDSPVIMFSNSTVGVVDRLEEQRAGGVTSENCESYS